MDRNLVLIAESMDLVELLPYLQQEGILREHHVEAVRKLTPYEGRLELISIIKRRGPRAFEFLCNGLALSGQTHLMEKLCCSETTPAALMQTTMAHYSNATLENGTGFEESHSPVPPTSPVVLDKFYAAESLFCCGVPATDGYLEQLNVEKCGFIPEDYNESEYYKNSSRPKGLALIINNHRFRGMPVRSGTDIDCGNLQRLFTQLGYVVKAKRDLTTKDMIETMLKFSQEKEHQKCDSAVVVILSHGLHGEIYGSDGKLISVERLILFLDAHHCPALINKPKLFFVQACRGSHLDLGREIDAEDEVVRVSTLIKLITMDENDAGELRKKIPSQADILIAWRNSTRGSWFIQAICEVFSKYACREEVLHLLTRTNGMIIRRADSCDSSDVFELAPFTLLPSPVPRRLFSQAVCLQKELSTLYHRVAFDFEFMQSALKGVVESDPFTAKLFEIYTAVMMQEGVESRLALNIQRSDFMLHDSGSNDSKALSLKQVEVNNISASFAGLGAQCSKLHKRIFRKLHPTLATEEYLPENKSLDTVSTGLVKAWEAYGQKDAAIAFISEDACRNIADHRLIEHSIEMMTGYRAPVIRLNLNECPKKLVSVDNRLFVHPGNVEVAVAYFRTGYLPHQFLDDSVWNSLLMIELSKAIKCPWVGFHLAGTKKVQQLLGKPENLRRFLKEQQAIDRILSVCMPMYGLERNSPETSVVLKEVLADPAGYVLKPQLEGGGNNFYGSKIISVLSSCSPLERESYIVMKKINGCTCENFIVRCHQDVRRQCVISELGIFGYLLGSKQDVVDHHEGGHLLRTKVMNELYYRVSIDKEFIASCLADIAVADPFIAKLLDIYLAVMNSADHEERIFLNIQRADYMFHKDKENMNKSLVLKQVEVNNISAGLAAIGPVCTKLHERVMRKAKYPREKRCYYLPENSSKNVVSVGLFEAWKAYGNKKAVVIFMIEDHPRNIADQRLIEHQFELLSEYAATVVRLKFNQSPKRLRMIGSTLHLIPENVEIGVVYFRTAYSPDQFEDDSVWSALRLIEMSTAIKCPWIGFHLAGVKKIQQTLSFPKNLGRFVKDAQTRRRILSVTMPMFGFDRSSSAADWETILSQAIKEPNDYVLKPLREGGGHNFYQDNMIELLKSCGPTERQAYILMERIKPPVHTNIFVKRNTESKLQACNSELGVFGCLLGNMRKIFDQRIGTFMLRTKLDSENEGGLMHGTACVDSPFIYDS
ncbi:Peptidase C14 and CARD and GSH synthase and GSH s ynth ATP domain containing protein [Trichuris trichiura]|uniref:Glutathione synthetase n=1 Tax=Trichuris trichiura TaxID=36087 RepID=A0A077Z3M8_TRITR|nr:Peptidase C14 and CARD and GSH synthase and GSH s ynth ATP domain containing protein [Trichuris trichiura]